MSDLMHASIVTKNTGACITESTYSLRASSPIWASEKRVSRERWSERRSREGQGKGELATISHKISFVLRPDEGKYHWLKNDVPEIKVD